MKCPKCGEETEAGQKCGKCGKDTGAFQEMEVEYKDFKVSELLDIKVTPHASEGESGKKPEPTAEKQPAEKKKISMPLSTFLILVLAAIAGFILLKFLLKF